MTDLENQIDALVRPFVAKLVAVLRLSARVALERALQGSTPDSKAGATSSPPRTRRKRRRVASSTPPPTPRAITASKSQPPGATQQNLPEYLAANPGQRMDQLSKSLSIPVPKLQTAMTSLLESGVVRREGQRRGVKYYVVASA